jgi:hypothetical protein
MNMTQLVFGSALGCMLAQGLLSGATYLIRRLQRPETGSLLRALSPGPKVIGIFVKYAAPVGVAAALITLGVWTVGDYVAAKSARNAALASTFDPQAAARRSPPPGAAEEAAAHTAAPEATPAAAEGGIDPYSDPEFKVQHRTHGAAGATLKDTLLQRAEAKASADLRRETQQHQQRSQYDCETADRAERYLKAGLDVWGFAAWQQRYFPAEDYKGSSLAQCKDIKALVPGSLDLQSTVAQDNHR